MKQLRGHCLYVLTLAALLAGYPSLTVAPAASPEPTVSLSLSNATLGQALAVLARDTGYRFLIDRQWHPLPVTIHFEALPLEQALQRLLRRLNHSLIWQGESTVKIMVYGEARNVGPAHSISFAAPPQEVPEESEPLEAVEPVDAQETEETISSDDGANEPDSAEAGSAASEAEGGDTDGGDAAAGEDAAADGPDDPSAEMADPTE